MGWGGLSSAGWHIKLLQPSEAPLRSFLLHEALDLGDHSLVRTFKAFLVWATYLAMDIYAAVIFLMLAALLS